MTKKASRSGVTIQVADGRGGLRPVPDHRFAVGAWPIEREFTDAEASSWMAHMKADVDERNWMSHGFGQLHPDENSGSLTIYMGQFAKGPKVEITWEKPRGGRLLVRARAGDRAHAVGAQLFIDSIDSRHRERRLHREHRRTWITYHGLPWEGELWLAPDIRLGPPSRRPAMLTGPQALLIDAMVSGIGKQGVTDEFHRLAREIKVVLGPVLGNAFDIEHQRYHDWGS